MIRSFGRLVRPALWTLLIGVAVSADATTIPLIPAHITAVENGWFGEGVAIWTDVAITGCAGTTPAEFAVLATHPAYKQIVAEMLTAYAQHSPILLTVDQGNCAMGRTAILGIRLN